MQKTIRFNLTSELIAAVTADSRRTASNIQGVLAFVAACAMLAAYVAACVDHVLAAWVLLSVSFLLLYTVISISLKFRKGIDENCQVQVRFSNDGFTYNENGEFVPWSQVHLVRRTSVFLALHFVRDGRNAFVAIPTNVIDDELGKLIDDTTTEAE